MPAFAYRAADKTGTARKGIIEASSPAAARALLREQALLPLSVEVAAEKGRSFLSIEPCPAESTKRSRSGHLGSAGAYFR